MKSMMSHMVKLRLAPVPAGAISPTYTPLDAAESDRNFRTATTLRKIAHLTNNERMRVVLPYDGFSSSEKHIAQKERQREWREQSVMPYNSFYMHTPIDTARLNNVAQQSVVSQRQLTVPNTYGQFYAFMHAMSAAFGTQR